MPAHLLHLGRGPAEGDQLPQSLHRVDDLGVEGGQPFAQAGALADRQAAERERGGADDDQRGHQHQRQQGVDEAQHHERGNRNRHRGRRLPTVWAKNHPSVSTSASAPWARSPVRRSRTPPGAVRSTPSYTFIRMSISSW